LGKTAKLLRIELREMANPLAAKIPCCQKATKKQKNTFARKTKKKKFKEISKTKAQE
jgi:hypothetical protein